MKDKETLSFLLQKLGSLHLLLQRLCQQERKEGGQGLSPERYLAFQNHFDELLQFLLGRLGYRYGGLNLEQRYLLSGLASLSVDWNVDLNRELTKANHPLDLRWDKALHLDSQTLEEVKAIAKNSMEPIREEVQSVLKCLPFEPEDFKKYVSDVLLISDTFMALSPERNEKTNNEAASLSKFEFIDPLLEGNPFLQKEIEGLGQIQK